MKLKSLALGLILASITANAAIADDIDASVQSLPNYSEIEKCSSLEPYLGSGQEPPEFCTGDVPFYWYPSNPSWSGHVVVGSTDVYTQVKALITTPADRSYSCGYGNWGAWVGLGGYNSSNLIQAGITNSPTVPGKYTFFIEYLNESNVNPPMFVHSQTFPPGTELLITVSYNRVTKKALFYLMNYSNGIEYTRTTNGDVSKYYDGSSAEWINEKNGPMMYNFGTFHWDDAQVRLLDGSWSNFGSEPGLGLKIVIAGNTIATPQFYPTTATSFVDKFYRCN